MVKRLALRPTRSSTLAATRRCGGLEISTMWRVAGSASSRSMAAKVESAPTSPLRSRLPTPMACEMPLPACAIRQLTSCRPVPDAPIRPISPRGTRLAKARGTPPMMAVPQSGPITRRPSACAFALQGDFLRQGDVVAKNHHVEAAAQGLARFVGGVDTRHRDQGKAGGRLLAQARCASCAVPCCRRLAPALRCRSRAAQAACKRLLGRLRRSGAHRQDQIVGARRP